jgi:hypothetical protein
MAGIKWSDPSAVCYNETTAAKSAMKQLECVGIAWRDYTGAFAWKDYTGAFAAPYVRGTLPECLTEPLFDINDTLEILRNSWISAEYAKRLSFGFEAATDKGLFQWQTPESFARLFATLVTGEWFGNEESFLPFFEYGAIMTARRRYWRRW